VIYRSINQAGLSEITLMVSVVLFPLMTIFILLDSTRYSVYIPLFTAGKIIGLFSLLGFPIINGQDGKFGILSEDANFITLLMISYLFSILIIFILTIMEKRTGGGNQSEEKNEEKKSEVV
jgi:formate hydrogenlyase subunit 3/multisubunit Na+/H+ antiporter MnhD subunit